MPITYDQTGVTYDAAAYTYNGDGYQPTVFPIAGVYISFTDGPYTATPAWTEVTQYVRSITTHRGRASDLDQFDTGTAQIVLDNRDRRFDPFYTSGPYYPNGLTPRRPIRIVGQIGGQTYEVFRGFVAGWPVTWSEAGKDSTVTIQCFDALGLMANEVVPTDWPGYYTASLAPRHYWKCNDAQTSTVRLDTGSFPININKPAAINYFEAPPLGAGLMGNSTFFPANSTGSSAVTSTANTGYTIGFWANIVTMADGDGLRVNYASKQVETTFLYIPTLGALAARVSVTVRNATGGVEKFFSTIPTDTPIYVVVVVTSTAGVNASSTVYVNGTALTETSTTSPAAFTTQQESVSVRYGALQEFFVVDSALTAAQIQTIYAYGSGRLSETTSARMTRLLDTTDWPAALESFPASPVGTVAEIGSGTGVVPELQLVADSEGGELYVSKTGVLTMTARRDVFNATRSAVSQATFTDSGAGIRYGTELNIEYDADNLKNDITVNYSGDGEVNLYSDAVITGYGAAATTIETQLDSPTSALDLATLELGVEGVLVPQISPIDVSPNTAAADWQTILGLELLDRVTFKRTPTVGNQFNRAALINAIDHQIEPGVWRTQLTLSMRYTSPLIVGDSVRGRVDYNYCG